MAKSPKGSGSHLPSGITGIDSFAPAARKAPKGTLGDVLGGVFGTHDLLTSASLQALRGTGGTSSGSKVGPVVNATLAPPFTPGDDYFPGTGGVDDVQAYDGADTLLGLTGNDILSANSGDDSAYGGIGDDTILGEAGNDYAEGGDGNDTINDVGAVVRTVTNEIQVNSNDNFSQDRPFVAYLSDSSGGFIVGYETDTGVATGSEVVTYQKFDRFGAKVGGAINFDANTSLAKGEIEITALKGARAGEYVVVWYSYSADQSDPLHVHDAYMSHYAADGTLIGASKILLNNAPTLYTTSRPSVVALDDGSWITVWQDLRRDTPTTDGWGVYGQHWTGNNVRVGSTFHISNDYITVHQGLPRAATLAGGNVVVMWTDTAREADKGVYFRIINPDEALSAAPTLVGASSTRVNTTTVGDQEADSQSIIALAGGGFVIAWNGPGTDASNGGADSQGIFFRIFDSNGAALGGMTERLAHTADNVNAQTNAAGTQLADGGFVLVCQQQGAPGDGSGSGLLGQRFDAAGNKVGGQFLINVTTAGNQSLANLTTLQDGTVVVTWKGDGSSGSDLDAYVRLFRFGSDGGHDTYFGQNGNDVLFGADGNDTLGGGSGADSLFGGTGSDWAYYTGATAAVTVNLNIGTASGDEANGDFLTGIEHLMGSSFSDSLVGMGTNLNSVGDVDSKNNTLVGLAGNDGLRGQAGQDALYGGDDNDLLTGGVDADYLDGGAGNDTASYVNSTSGVEINLILNVGQVGGEAAGDVLTDVENIIGSNFADYIRGQYIAGFVNTFVGLDGSDTLDGSQGGDSLDGGSGEDWAFYEFSAAAVNVNLSDNVLESGGMANGDWLTNIEHIKGSSLGDVITGTSTGSNTLRGLSGNDILAGLSGADTLFGDAGQDIADYSASASGIVVVNLSDNLTETGGDAEGDFLTGIEHLYGSSFNKDVFTGNAGANMLYGREGDDTLDGGGGVDSEVGGAGNDLLFYDTFDAILSGGSGLDTLVATNGVDLISLNDAKFTANPFEGAPDAHSIEIWYLAGGNDTLYGATASDAYDTLDRTGMLVYGGDGNDYVAFKYKYAAGADNPTRNTNNNDTAFGGSGSDTFYGNYGDDTLFGGEGTVAGDNSGDLLYGGKGNDTLYGGSGYDNYYFGRNEGKDRIYDYAAPSSTSTNALTLTVGNESKQYGALGNSYDGVDPTEVTIFYGATDVTVSIDQNDVFDPNNYVVFDKGAISQLVAEDYALGDAGNSTVAPLGTNRDVWQANWNTATQMFDTWGKIIDN